MSKGNDQPQSGNVLTLEPRARQAQSIDRIERYWNKVRGNRLVPSRFEIDPRGLEGVLGHAFILERIAGGLARFRIAGSHLSELTGLELRQMPLSALFLPESREALSEAMQDVFDGPTVVRMTVASPAGFGRQHLQGELILLPLRSDLGDIDRVLGGLVFEGKVGRTPRRIEILEQTRRSLTGYAGPAHGEATGPAKPTARPGKPPQPKRPVETPAPDQAAMPKAGIERRHLRLVVTND